jgi:hypothetical protein
LRSYTRQNLLPWIPSDKGGQRSLPGHVAKLPLLRRRAARGQMFSGFQLVFSYELLDMVVQDPGAVLEPVAGVEFRVVARAGLLYFPENF